MSGVSLKRSSELPEAAAASTPAAAAASTLAAASTSSATAAATAGSGLATQEGRVAEGEESPIPPREEQLDAMRSFHNFSGWNQIYPHFRDGAVKCWELQRVSSEFVASRRSSGDGPSDGGGRAKGCRGFKTFPRLKDAVVESAFREGVFDRATQAEDAAAAVGRDFECFAFPEVGDAKESSAMREDAAYRRLRAAMPSLPSSKQWGGQGRAATLPPHP